MQIELKDRPKVGIIFDCGSFAWEESDFWR